MPFVNNIHAHGNGSESKVFLFILNMAIIETVIGDILFYPDDVDVVMQQQVLIILKVLSDDNDDEMESSVRDKYITEGKQAKKISLSVNLIDLGNSFQRYYSLLLVISEERVIYEYGGSCCVKISNYVPVV